MSALRLQRPVRPTDSSQWVPVTKFSDSVTQPALSPDGRMVAFIRGESSFYGPGQIYVKILPDGEPVQLTHDNLDKMSPVFSPDGPHRLHHRNPDFQWDTWTVPVLGGEPQMMLKNASGLVWTGPRRIMFSEIRMGVHMAVVTSEESRAGQRDVYVPPDEPDMAHRSYLSPDGKWVLLVEMDIDHLWEPCRLVPVDGSSSGQKVGPLGRRLHIRRVVARWQMDVFHLERRGCESHLAAAFSRRRTRADHRGSDRRGRHCHGA